MPPDTADTTYTDPFHAECINNNLPQVQKALTSGQLSPETLSTGLIYINGGLKPRKCTTLGGEPLFRYVDSKYWLALECKTNLWAI